MLLLLYYLGAQPQTGPDLALGAKYVPTTMQLLVQGFFLGRRHFWGLL